MKVSFIKVDGIEYMAQYDKKNVFFSTKVDGVGRPMAIIEILNGEIISATSMKSGNVQNLSIDDSIKFNKSAHDIVRHYAPILQQVVSFNEKVA